MAVPQMDGPLPFLRMKGEEHFELLEGAEVLKSIDAPVAIVATAGPARSGKSSLLNLLGAPNFDVGSTVTPCTQGIWIYVKPERVDGVCIVFMDSEGTGSTEKDETHDARVFALTLLASSVFVYNSRGAISESSIEQLSVIASLTKHIHTKTLPEGEEDDGTTFAEIFPKFVWVLRDFSLSLSTAGPGGSKATSRSYLEDSLRLQDGFSDAVQAKNRIRAMLQSFFSDRDCVPIVRPYDQEADLQGGLVLEKTRPEFREAIDLLKGKLLEQPQVKVMHGNPVSGAMIVELARVYVQAINTGAVPVMSNAWASMVRLQNERAVDQAFAMYASSNVGEGAGGSAMKERHVAAFEACLAKFNDEVMMEESAPYKEALDKRVNEEYTRLCENKERECEETTRALLDELSAPVRESLRTMSGGDGDGDVAAFKASLDEVIDKGSADALWTPLGAGAVIAWAKSGYGELMQEFAVAQARAASEAAAQVAAKVAEEKHELELAKTAAEGEAATQKDRADSAEASLEEHKVAAIAKQGELEKTISDLEDQITSLTAAAAEQAAAAKAAAEDAASKNKALRAQMDTAEEALTKANGELKEVRDLSESKQKELEAQLESLRIQSDEAIGTCKAEVARLTQELADSVSKLEAERTQAKEERAVLEKEGGDALAAAKASAASVQSELASLKEGSGLELTHLREQVEQLETSLKDMEESSAAEIKGLKGQVDEARASYESSSSETSEKIRTLTHDLERSKSARESAEEKLRSSAKEVDELKQSVRDARQENSTLSEQIKEAWDAAKGSSEGMEAANEQQRERLQTIETTLKKEREAFRVREESLEAELKREHKAREALEVRWAEAKAGLATTEFELFEMRKGLALASHMGSGGEKGGEKEKSSHSMRGRLSSIIPGSKAHSKKDKSDKTTTSVQEEDHAAVAAAASAAHAATETGGGGGGGGGGGDKEKVKDGKEGKMSLFDRAKKKVKGALHDDDGDDDLQLDSAYENESTPVVVRDLDHGLSLPITPAGELPSTFVAPSPTPTDRKRSGSLDKDGARLGAASHEQDD